jgi:hypothetical protein
VGRQRVCDRVNLPIGETDVKDGCVKIIGDFCHTIRNRTCGHHLGTSGFQRQCDVHLDQEVVFNDKHLCAT